MTVNETMRGHSGEGYSSPLNHSQALFSSDFFALKSLISVVGTSERFELMLLRLQSCYGSFNTMVEQHFV